MESRTKRIVVICRSDEDRTMFENGETIGNLNKNEIPGFPCLVIKDNERMKVVNKQTRSGNIVYAFQMLLLMEANGLINL